MKYSNGDWWLGKTNLGMDWIKAYTLGIYLWALHTLNSLIVNEHIRELIAWLMMSLSIYCHFVESSLLVAEWASTMSLPGPTFSQAKVQVSGLKLAPLTWHRLSLWLTMFRPNQMFKSLSYTYIHTYIHCFLRQSSLIFA